MDKEGENPLPDVIRVQPEQPQKIAQLAGEVKKLAPQKIDKIDYAEVVTRQVLGFSSFLRNLVLVFAIALSLLSAFLISNTIKLTILARREEIEIQRLVGASDWFIRWPFFLEGAFIGLSGAVVPAILILILNHAVGITLGAVEKTSIIKMMPLPELALNVVVSLFLLGAVIGIWGSIISMRRFLKV
jgi:cell division transport system permease protein